MYKHTENIAKMHGVCKQGMRESKKYRGFFLMIDEMAHLEHGVIEVGLPFLPKKVLSGAIQNTAYLQRKCG